MPSGAGRWTAALLIALFLLVPSQGVARAKTDRITLDNGDHITCEIKTLQQGQLTVTTDYSRTMQLDWRAVRRIVSSQYFQLVLVDGRRIYGTLADSGEDHVIGVQLLDATTRLPTQEVSSLTPLQQGFLQRLSGSVNIGASALKSNKQRTLNLGNNVTYRSRSWYASAHLDWYTSDQENSPRTNQANLGASGFRLIGRRWAIVSTASFSKNDELDLDLRTSVAFGAGYRVLETNNRFFLLMAGLNATEEKYGSSPGGTTNLEGNLSVIYNTFTFRKPQVSFNVALDLYPSLTVSGRYRVSLTSYLHYEVISDFFVGFNANYSWDSKPPTTSGAGTDWTLTMSVGYTFSP